MIQFSALVAETSPEVQVIATSGPDSQAVNDPTRVFVF